MSNEEKLNSLKTAQAEKQAQIEKLLNEQAKIKESLDKLPEGKKKQRKENELSANDAALAAAKSQLRSINAMIREVNADIKRTTGKGTSTKTTKTTKPSTSAKTTKSGKTATTKKVVKKTKATEETKKKSNWGYKVLGLIILAGGLIVFHKCAGKNKNCSPNMASVADSLRGNSNTTLETEDNEFKSVLNDVDNDNQVKEQASIIYNKLQKMLTEEKSNYLSFIATQENIEDMICTLFNGRKPINSSTLNQMITLNDDIFANVGLENNLYVVNYAEFFENGSLEQAIAKEYDEIYANIAKSRRENNDAKFIEYVGQLANKFWNQYYLAGLNGDFNPYAVKENKQNGLFLAATSRVSNYVWEHIENLRLVDPNFVICILTCYNTNGEQVLRSFEEIEHGLYTGKSFTDEVICKRDNNIFIPSEDAYNKLVAYLSSNITMGRK